MSKASIRFFKVIFLGVILLVLTACRFYELIMDIDHVEIIHAGDQVTLVYQEGEDFLLDEYQLKVVFTEGQETVINLHDKDVSHNYNPYPFEDMHFEQGSMSVFQDVVFSYKKYSAEAITVETIRNTVESVSISSSPSSKFSYMVGDFFDINGFELFVTNQNGTTQIIDLRENMIDLDSLELLDANQSLSFYIYYNGVRSNNQITISVSKHERFITSDLLDVREVGHNFIELGEVEGAVYAINSTDSTNNLQWMTNPLFEDLNFNYTYYVFMRLVEDDVFYASNVVSREVTTLIKPELIELTPTTAKFTHNSNFTVLLFEPNNILNPIEGSIINDSTTEFINLVPNKTYNVHLIARTGGIIGIGDVGVLVDTVKTNEVLNPFTFSNLQTLTYNNSVQSYQFEFKEGYTHLSKDDVVLEYRNLATDEVIINPVDVGTYRVTFNHPYSNTSLVGGTFSITRQHVNMKILSSSKSYFEDDPDFDLEITSGVLYQDLADFDIVFSRQAGETVGTYRVSAQISDPNYYFHISSSLLSIHKKEVDVIVNDLTIIYGNENINYSYTLLDELDYFEGHLDNIVESYQVFGYVGSNINHFNVGSYEIRLNLLSDFYQFNIVNGTLSVHQKDLVVTPFELSKEYYSIDPQLLYSVSGLEYNDTIENSISGNLYRESGEDVGLYEYDFASLASDNYNLLFDYDIKFEIEPIVIDVLVNNNLVNIYGTPNNTLFVPYVLPNRTFINDDEDDLSLYVINDEINVGTYDLEIGYTLDNNNYLIVITNENNTLQIDPYEVWITEHLSYEYNNVDQRDIFVSDLIDLINNGEYLLYDDELTLDALLSFSEQLKYVVDSNNQIDTYLDLGTNYVLAEASLITFTVTPKDVVITYSDYEGLIYNGLAQSIDAQSDDVFASDEIRIVNNLNINAGIYTSSVEIYNADNENITSSYNISNNSIEYTIYPKEISIELVNQLSKVYGSTDPVVTYSDLVVLGIENSENVEDVLFNPGLFSRSSGEDVGEYSYTFGAASLNSNYVLEIGNEIGSLVINKLLIEVKYTFDQDEYVYGDDLIVDVDVVNGVSLPFDNYLNIVNSNPRFNAGTYELEVRVLDSNNNDISDNYLIIDGVIEYTIDKLKLEVEIGGFSAPYGSAIQTMVGNHVNVLTNDDLVKGDLVADLGSITYESPANAASVAGTYPLTVLNGYTNPNYEYIYIEGTIEIEHADVIFDYDESLLNYVYDFEQFSMDFIAIDPTNNNEELTDVIVVVEYYLRSDSLLSNEIDAPVNVGLYTILVYIIDEHERFDASPMTLQLTINPKEITIDDTFSLVYSGSDLLEEFIDELNNYVVDNELLISGDLAAVTTSYSAEVLNSGIHLLGQTEISFLGGNYVLSNGSVIEFVIEKVGLLITPNILSKEYYDLDPELTFTVSGLVGLDTELDTEDVVLGELLREAGEAVGTYDYDFSELSSDNYDLSFDNTVKFEIVQKELTFNETYSLEYNGYNQFSAFIALLQTDLNELMFEGYEEVLVVDSQVIRDYVLSGYTLTDADITFTSYRLVDSSFTFIIEKASLVITPNEDQFKIYDDSDPVINYTVDGYKSDDSNLVIGILSRIAGENVGSYEILPGSIDVDSDNYELIFTEGALFEITRRLITITIDDNSKTYGDSDQVFTFVSSEEDYLDELEVVLTRELGENVGSYEISIASVNDSNFVIVEEKGNFTITKATLLITPNHDSKIYGDEDPEFTYSVSGYLFTDSDLVSGALGRETGENVGSYEINLGGLVVEGGNYELAIVDGVDLEIISRPITITIDNAIKSFGEDDPDFIFSLSDNDYINEFNLTFSRVSGEDIGSYEISLLEIGTDNFLVTEVKGYLEITKGNPTLVGNEPAIGEFAVYSAVYNNNMDEHNVTVDDFKVIANGIDYTSFFDFNFDITTLDLSNGGTTFVVDVELISNNLNFNDLYTTVVYKFKSVTIGNNENYMTIEDAIPQANSSSENILVRANTKFAEEDIAELIYGYNSGKGYNLSGKITVSYYQNENYITEFNSASAYSNATARQTPDVTLILSENLKLNVKNNAEIFINAERYAQSTNVTGLVDGNKYGVLYVEENSEIIFESGAKFTNYGFSAGPGIMYSLAGSIIVEFMTIFDYKGGSITGTIYSDAVPILYFAPLAITNEIIFVNGSDYRMYTFVTASENRYFSTVDVLKLGNNYPMFDLKSGTLTKSVLNGKAKFVFDNATLDLVGDIRITMRSALGNITFNASGKDLSLGAFYDIHVRNNSFINQQASIMLIGGSTITVDASSTINVNNKLYIDEKYEYITVQATPLNNLTGTAKNNAFYDYDFIYNQTQTDNYLVYDSITKNSANRSTLHIDSNANINIGDNGKVAGYVNETLFNRLSPLLEADQKTFTVKRIKGSGLSASAPDVRVNFDLIDNWSGEPEEEGSGGGGSPFLYSEDSNGNIHFEHEPISFKLLKTVEGASYGTLRLLQAQNGLYYIQVIEEGSSITVLDNIQLYAVDYVDDGTVLDLFFDIAGNPHTIRQRLTPVSFVDQHGNSYLNEVLNKDGAFAQYDITNDSTLSYFTATFDRPNNNRYAKFMFSVQDAGNTSILLQQLLSTFNAPQNFWWLDQAFMASPVYKQYIKNIFDAMEVKVQVWNGTEWITQGSVELGTYLMESFLVELDLEGITGNQIQVRLVAPTAGEYLIDDVSIDFTENLPMIIHTMTLESAILNGTIDVLDILSAANNQYVELAYKEGVRFGFGAPALASGYSRGFGVKMTGYIYPEGAQVADPLQELMDGKDFEEIKQIIINSGRQELIDDIPLVEEFYNTILYVGSQEYEMLLEILFSMIGEPVEDD